MRADAVGLIESDAEIYDCWTRIGVRGDKSCPELARSAADFSSSASTGYSTSGSRRNGPVGGHHEDL